MAACLLHDVPEDTEATEEDLNVTEDVVEAVRLVTFPKDEDRPKAELKEGYFNAISKNPIASMVKLLDRCNNVSQMALGMYDGFGKKKIADYIDETEKYVLPLLDIVKHEYDEYYNAIFLLKYHMMSVIETLKRML